MRKPTKQETKQDKKPAKTGGAAALKGGKKVGPSSSPVQVRDAGEENMANHQEHWDKQDEASDESFPASDPPGNY